VAVELTSQSQLTIHTVRPMMAWNFGIGGNMLEISSTATNAVLMAQTPAPSNRKHGSVPSVTGFHLRKDSLLVEGTQEAMRHTAGVHIVSRNSCRRVAAAG
jgi:hypothetical protein